MSTPDVRDNPALNADISRYIGYLQRVRGLAQASIRAYENDLHSFAEFVFPRGS